MEIEWSGRSFKIIGNSILRDYIQENSNLRYNNNGDEMFNDSSEYWIFENDFFKKNEQTILRIFEKIGSKNFGKPIYWLNDGKFEIIAPNSTELNIFKDMISENNINDINKKNLNVSIEFLNKTEVDKNIVNIYILIFLANKTERKGNEFKFIFQSDSSKYSYDIEYPKLDPNLELTSLYNWIISDKNVIHTKIIIVRKIISISKTFEKVEYILESSQGAFARIISQETDKYFEQLDDFQKNLLSIAEEQGRVNRTLHLSFLGWITTLGVAIFEVSKNIQNFTINQLKILLFMLGIGLFVALMIYLKEHNDIKKTVELVKDTYKYKKILPKSIFEKLEEPKISISYIIIIGILVGVILVLLFLPDLLSNILGLFK